MDVDIYIYGYICVERHNNVLTVVISQEWDSSALFSFPQGSLFIS